MSDEIEEVRAENRQLFADLEDEKLITRLQRREIQELREELKLCKQALQEAVDRRVLEG